MKGKKAKIILIVAVIAVLAIAAVVGILLLTNGGHRVIKVESFDGDVALERDGDEVDIFEGLKLKSKDEVTTGNASQIELLADEDKYILARENTQFEIISEGNKKEGRLKIKLSYGETLIDIENKLPDEYDFEVSTPNASLSVRGTTFTVNYSADTNTTVVNVTEGKVKVESDNGEVMVEKDHEAVITDTALLLDGNVVTGNQQIQDGSSQVVIPYLEQVAFEAVHSTEGTPMGVFVKQLEGFTPYESTGSAYFFCDQLSGEYDVRYNIFDEIPVWDSSNSGYTTIDESIMPNADNVDITVRRCVGTGDGTEYVDYVFYKPLMYSGQPCYLAIIVMSKNMSVDELGMAYFLHLTRDMYYNYDYTVVSPVVSADSDNVAVNAFNPTDEIAFEVKNQTTREGSGVYVKNLEGWEYQVKSADGDMYDELTKDGVYIRYWVVNEPAEYAGFNEDDDISYFENGDKIRVRTDTINYNGTNGVIDKAFIFYKQMRYTSEPDTTYYVMLMVYDEQGGKLLGNAIATDYIEITRNMFFEADATVAFPVVAGDSTAENKILPTDIWAFTINNTINDDIPAVMTKRLEGWDWTVVTESSGSDNEFISDGVHIRYRLIDTLTAQEIFDTYSYEMVDNSKYIPTRVVTIEDDPQNPDRNTQYVYFMALRFEGEGYVRDFYMEISVFDIKGAESASMGDINTYIDLTTEDFYVFTEPSVMITYIP